LPTPKKRKFQRPLFTIPLEMVKMSMHVHGTIRNSVDGKATLEGNIAEIQEAILQKPL
jgi:hypothetical protein